MLEIKTEKYKCGMLINANKLETCQVIKTELVLVPGMDHL